jgi:hypothetical protein
MHSAKLRNGVVTLVGTGGVVVLSELIRRWAFLQPDRLTPLSWLELVLNLLLLALPGVAIGFHATRRTARLGAIAYALGELIIIYRSNWFGYRGIGDFLPQWPYPLYGLRVILIFAAIGAALGWLGAQLRHRLKNRLEQSRG